MPWAQWMLVITLAMAGAGEGGEGRGLGVSGYCREVQMRSLRSSAPASSLLLHLRGGRGLPRKSRDEMYDELSSMESDESSHGSGGEREERRGAPASGIQQKSANVDDKLKLSPAAKLFLNVDNDDDSSSSSSGMGFCHQNRTREPGAMINQSQLLQILSGPNDTDAQGSGSQRQLGGGPNQRSCSELLDAILSYCRANSLSDVRLVDVMHPVVSLAPSSTSSPLPSVSFLEVSFSTYWSGVAAQGRVVSRRTST
eukprot:761519-Hanusia_phi.AAC.4